MVFDRNNPTEEKNEKSEQIKMCIQTDAHLFFPFGGNHAAIQKNNP